MYTDVYGTCVFEMLKNIGKTLNTFKICFHSVNAHQVLSTLIGKIISARRNSIRHFCFITLWMTDGNTPISHSAAIWKKKWFIIILVFLFKPYTNLFCGTRWILHWGRIRTHYFRSDCVIKCAHTYARAHICTHVHSKLDR